MWMCLKRDAGYKVKDRDRERANEGGDSGDRQSCLSFLRWDRLSSLFSPLLTWPQIWKKKRKEKGSGWEKGNSEERWKGENDRCTFSSPFLAALWWLTDTDLETSTKWHRYCKPEMWLWPSPSVHSLCNHEAFVYSSAETQITICNLLTSPNVLYVIYLQLTAMLQL